MLLVEIAAYILFITLILFYSTKVLWLFFLLFCYRFYESTLTYSFLSKYIHFSHERDYFIIIIILSILTYFGMILLTKNMQFLRYILLLAMALYVLRQPDYGLKEVFLFKDYLKDHGMWNSQYWVDQLKALFLLGDEQHKSIFEKVLDNIISFFQRMIQYVRGL